MDPLPHACLLPPPPGTSFPAPSSPPPRSDEINPLGVDYSRNQLFDQSGFAPLVRKLQDSQASGVGAVALTDLTTLENSWYVKREKRYRL